MKTYNYIFIMVGMMILFYLAGIATTTGYILSKFDLANNPQDFQQSEFFTIVVGIFAGVLVSGIVIGYFTKSSPESYLVAPFAAILMLFVGDAISIIVYAQSLGYAWLTYLITLIFAPIIVGYVLSVVEWWRGVD